MLTSYAYGNGGKVKLPLARGKSTMGCAEARLRPCMARVEARVNSPGRLRSMLECWSRSELGKYDQRFTSRGCPALSGKIIRQRMEARWVCEGAGEGDESWWTVLRQTLLQSRYSMGINRGEMRDVQNWDCGLPLVSATVIEGCRRSVWFLSSTTSWELPLDLVNDSVLERFVLVSSPSPLLHHHHHQGRTAGRWWWSIVRFCSPGNVDLDFSCTTAYHSTLPMVRDVTRLQPYLPWSVVMDLHLSTPDVRVLL